MLRVHGIAVGIAVAAVLLFAGASGAQPPATDTPSTPPPVTAPPTVPTVPETTTTPTAEEGPSPPPPSETVTEGLRVPEEVLPSDTATVGAPRVFTGPDLFNPPAHQGWITLTPSFTLSGEYNDNINLTGRDRESDFIIGFTPALTLSMQRQSYRILAGYNTTGEVYIDNSD